MLSIVANQAASAIQNARALQRERLRAKQMELVSEVARSTAAIFDLRSLLPRLTSAIQRAFGCDFVGIFLVDDFKQHLVCEAATHPSLVGQRCQMGSGLVGACVAEGQLIIVDDVRDDARIQTTFTLPFTLSEAVMPLHIGDSVIGALDLQSAQLGAFSHEDTHYLKVLAQQVAIAVEDARLYEQSLERQQLEQELNFAREIQTSFLPRESPAIPGWDICAEWNAARHVGGDFYDYLTLPDGKLGIVIADVAGKGVPAALFMVMTRTLMRAVALSRRSPAEALARVNSLIRSDSASDLFVTMLYAQVNPQTGEVCFSSAGHNPPLHSNAHGQVCVCRLHGMALGVMESITLNEMNLQMSCGDVLLLYTDGLTDALNPRGESFGVERLKRALQDNHNRGAAEIARALREAVEAFAEDEPPFDDETLVVLKRNAPTVDRWTA